MLGGIKPDDRISTMQDRVQRHYGGIVRAGASPLLTTTDLSAANADKVQADPNWEQALSQAMDRSNALMAAQADISAREAEVARREAQLNQREKALQTERRRSFLDPLLDMPRKTA